MVSGHKNQSKGVPRFDSFQVKVTGSNDWNATVVLCLMAIKTKYGNQIAGSKVERKVIQSSW